MWEIVETKAKKIGIAKIKRRKKERKDRKKVRREGGKKKDLS